MRILLVHAHPLPDSFGAAMRDAVLRGLATQGHEVRVLDLYESGFEPRLSAEECLAYQDVPHNQVPVAEHIAAVKWADGLVFVFPTWWYGMPAILKGWLDRVFVPGFAFVMDEGGGTIRPGLTHLRLLAGVTSCGAPWWFSKYVGEPQRRIILRGIGALCGRGCKKFWLAHFNMDTASKASLSRYLTKIERRFARFR